MSNAEDWCKRVLNYQFSDSGLLTRALTHRSASRANNERLEFLGDVAKGSADEWRFLRKAGTDHDHLSVRHVGHLVGAWKVEQLEDLSRRFGIGVDEQVGAGGLPDRMRCGAAQAGGFDPADRLLDAHRLPHHGGDQVGLVVRCHGHEEFAVFHAGSAERFGMSATPNNRQDVERVIEASQLRAAEIDDRNVVTFSTQAVGHVRADLAGTHNDYVHRSVLLLCERDVEPRAQERHPARNS